MRLGVLPQIQALRAAAALMVVWQHAREQFTWVKDTFPSEIGAQGVDIFFVISGFIMVASTHGQEVSPWRFLWRRFLRIAPLYWLVTLSLLLLGLLLPQFMRSATPPWQVVLTSLTFYPYASPVKNGAFVPLLNAGWTLNYEMFFYGIFAASLVMTRPAIRLFTMLLAMSAAISYRLVAHPTGVLSFYGDAIILVFLAGALLGTAYCSGGWREDTATGSALMALGGFLFWAGEGHDLYHRAIGAGIPALIIVAGTCKLSAAKIAWPKWMLLLGDASYSIYLSHILSLGLWRALLGKLMMVSAPAWMAGLFMLSSLIFSALVGLFAYRWIERPLSKALNRFR